MKPPVMRKIQCGLTALLAVAGAMGGPAAWAQESLLTRQAKEIAATIGSTLPKKSGGSIWQRIDAEGETLKMVYQIEPGTKVPPNFISLMQAEFLKACEQPAPITLFAREGGKVIVSFTMPNAKVQTVELDSRNCRPGPGVRMNQQELSKWVANARNDLPHRSKDATVYAIEDQPNLRVIYRTELEMSKFEAEQLVATGVAGERIRRIAPGAICDGIQARALVEQGVTFTLSYTAKEVQLGSIDIDLASCQRGTQGASGSPTASPPARTSQAAPAAAPAPGGLGVRIGDSIAQAKAALNTSSEAQPFETATSKGGWSLKDAQQGVTVFFDKEGRARTIRIEAPFSGAIRGVRIGDSLATVKARLGEPSRPSFKFGPNDAYLYNGSDNGPGNTRFDTNAAGQVTTIFVLSPSY